MRKLPCIEVEGELLYVDVSKRQVIAVNVKDSRKVISFNDIDMDNMELAQKVGEVEDLENRKGI